MTSPSAATLAARTPPTRDRYVDLLRVVALGTVVVGHWLLAVPVRDGGFRVDNLLAIEPATQPLTWLFQVMPLFFLVGGFSHAALLSGRRPTYAAFVRSRCDRLLRPAAVFVGLWLVAGLVLPDSGATGAALRTVAQPLWFLGVYVGIVAAAPPMLALHFRYGLRVVVTLAAMSALLDGLRFGLHVPDVGWLTVATVWLAVHQLGYAWRDGLLDAVAPALAVGGPAAAVALTTAGPYPVSMVGLPGAPVSNMSPPTLALLAHACWLVGLAVVLRAPARRWLDRPRVWTGVIAANGVAMTVFLWHLTALFLVTGLLEALHVVQPDAGSVTWWLTRPMWVAPLAAVTVVLVVAFRRCERPVRRAGGPRHAAIGAGLAAAGLLAFSAVGFGGLLTGRSAHLVMIPVTPGVALAALAAGILVLRGRGE